MKLFNHISLGVIGTMFCLSSCSYYERFDTPTPGNKPLPETTTTFAELKKEYLGNPDYLLHDNAGHPKYAKTFTSYQIPAESNKIINAVVVSSDIEGNTYKKMVLRDLSDSSAMDISINASGLSAPWPQGQVVKINCSGFQIGLYADSPTMGFEFYNSDPKRTRWELGRISYPIACNRITAVGMPDSTLIAPEVKTIAEIKELGTEAYGHLVRIKNVKFGYYVKAGVPDFFETPDIKYVNDTQEEDIPFSYENSIGVPVSRALSDGTGTINLTTSSYAKFASNGLPIGTYDIIAIVGWYRDQPAKNGSYQLSLQRFADIIKVTK